MTFLFQMRYLFEIASQHLSDYIETRGCYSDSVTNKDKSIWCFYCYLVTWKNISTS